MGERTSLRHAVQLLTPAMMLARTNGRDAISKGDLEVGAVPRAPYRDACKGGDEGDDGAGRWHGQGANRRHGIGG